MKQTRERTSYGFAAAAALSLALALFSGCRNNETPEEEIVDPTRTESPARDLDADLVSDVNDAALANGIVAQNTLYPHHFTPGGASLNTLGERDVAVLAEHYRSTPAATGQRTLNVRRGDTPGELYAARVKAVNDILAREGVPANSVRIADGRAGGTGMASDRVRTVLERDALNKPYYEESESTSLESGGSSSTTSGGGESR